MMYKQERSPTDCPEGYLERVLSEEELNTLAQNIFEAIEIPSHDIKLFNFAPRVYEIVQIYRSRFNCSQESYLIKKIVMLFYEKYHDTKMPLTVPKDVVIPALTEEDLLRKKAAHENAPYLIALHQAACDQFNNDEGENIYVFDVKEYCASGIITPHIFSQEDIDENERLFKETRCRPSLIE